MKQAPLSSPGLTGRPSIPETVMFIREAAAYWIARSSIRPGDMGNGCSETWVTHCRHGEAQEAEHAMAQGVPHGSEERVDSAVAAGCREPAGAVPAVRDQPEDRLQMVSQGNRRGERLGA